MAVHHAHQSRLQSRKHNFAATGDSSGGGNGLSTVFLTNVTLRSGEQRE